MLRAPTKMAIKFKFTYSLIFVMFIIVFLATLHHHSRRDLTAVKRNGLYYRNDFISSASNYTIAAYLRNLTGRPHLAGTPSSLGAAVYVKSHFERLKLDTRVVNYTVLLSYPLSASVTACFSNGSDVPVPLSEPGVTGDGGGGVVMPYHAYSPSGSAYGKAVFLNYGRDDDYRELAAVGVDVEGCVGIVRRGGGLSRSEAVERAASRGVAAVLMYTDGDREKFAAGVERGTVMSSLGDPLSPGWETGEKLRLDDPRVRDKFPKVPSLPISMAAAGIILRSLEGAEIPQQWTKNLKNSGIDFKKVGPGPTMLNFSYQGEKKMATIHNVFGIIRGLEEPDRFVVLGNHRDAWTYGAVDPNSGTAALLDIARRYARLVSLGWNPRRTIMLCSWDAEEFGMIGSTEFVEQNLMNLAAKSVAYLNVDCAVQGPGFFASATPQLDDLLLNVAKMVRDPDNERMTIFETWAVVSNRGANIQRLSRVDSDFASFLQLAGIPSVDLYYGKDFPVYHTAFDSYDWMIKFGDPFFQRHMAVSGVWGLLGLHLADEAVLPFNYEPYAAELLRYTRSLSGVLEGGVSLDPIFDAIRELTAAAKAIEEEAKKLRKDETMAELLILERRMLNDRLMSAERGFLNTEGVNGRQWFKHLVYGPSTGGETELDFFPGIVDAVSRSTHLNNTERGAIIQHEIWRVARAIQRAAYALKGNLT
ncbi:PREDICTED: probable glutamate carboxypeptidase 2 [Ipomoea nil]|uniref:probable glutamate carboxypeptidase 2 n=1 Tax=Ipomoea nil TaxID=35883 RepID=UPI0009015F6D|nr:PREDICTED: probable glutamate carboxypeptidase 2 [Ipomoea nil]